MRALFPSLHIGAAADEADVETTAVLDADRVLVADAVVTDEMGIVTEIEKPSEEELDELEELRDELDAVDFVIDVGCVSVFVGVLFGSSGGSVGNGISPPKAAPPPPPPPQKRIHVHPRPRGQMIRVDEMLDVAETNPETEEEIVDVDREVDEVELEAGIIAADELELELELNLLEIEMERELQPKSLGFLKRQQH
ncbi:hypothetical protein TCE0_044r16286 [Talaromyces pinophilus]|uniref:Uncharacterized protein n=1 Tax=Talaromyces pinophilus TaxID=128442 RepID=A0A478EAM2_TALPI|nr:hypothetical protein TCE0_044r16286 [Talaromyces pinophilus]